MAAARAGVLATVVLFCATPSAAQLPTITFPDTAVGAAATVKCPTTSVSLCFGSSCSASGTVQSVSGPSAPFSIGKFNLLSNAEFFAGNCEAHPVTLPVTVGPGQILAYQATFAPTSAGSASGTATFSTSGGTATVPLSGNGIPARTDKGAIVPQINSTFYVPGNFLNVTYQTRRGTLQGAVDLYFVVVLPNGSMMFLKPDGTLVTGYVAFRTNVTVTDGTTGLASFPFPATAPFGTYTFAMALVYAGKDPTNSSNWASAVSTVTFTFTALSPTQQSIVQSRGNPDLLAVTWVDEQSEKLETWIYLSGPPTLYRFGNGMLISQGPASVSTGGTPPKVDPALFTPQTTLQQLRASFGNPTSISPLAGAPELQAVSYAFGLTVVLRNGQLSSASTLRP